MLHYALIFVVVALVVTLLGLVGLTANAAGLGQLLAIGFILLSVGSALRRRGR